MDLSLDFFYVAPALDAFGLSLFPAPSVHPAELALFNLVNAWSLMFLGLLATDSRGAPRAAACCHMMRRVDRDRLSADTQRYKTGARLPLLPVWSCQMFLTNVFLLPWLAARAAPDAAAAAEDADAGERLPPPLATLASSPVLGLVGGVVGAASLLWFALAPVPEAVDGIASLSERWDHLVAVASEDRLTLAFGVDCVVYSAAQAWLIGDERALLLAAQPDRALPPAWLRFVPFAGMAAWLAARPQPELVAQRRT